jgi:uncharacterized membrane protein YedE/YeeE
VSPANKTRLAALAAGVVFGGGLVLAGMTQPRKVIGFLDLFGGAWDPSLAVVMAGAIGVHAVAYRLVKGRPSPLWAERWSVPSRSEVDGRLLLGAALFGVGWGLGGFCPGPGLVSLVGGAASGVVFVTAMVTAMILTTRIEARIAPNERHGTRTLPPAPQARP